jgi:hypothetical protein
MTKIFIKSWYLCFFTILQRWPNGGPNLVFLSTYRPRRGSVETREVSNSAGFGTTFTLAEKSSDATWINCKHFLVSTNCFLLIPFLLQVYISFPFCPLVQLCFFALLQMTLTDYSNRHYIFGNMISYFLLVFTARYSAWVLSSWFIEVFCFSFFVFYLTANW